MILITLISSWFKRCRFLRGAGNHWFLNTLPLVFNIFCFHFLHLEAMFRSAGLLPFKRITSFFNKARHRLIARKVQDNHCDWCPTARAKNYTSLGHRRIEYSWLGSGHLWTLRRKKFFLTRFTNLNRRYTNVLNSSILNLYKNSGHYTETVRGRHFTVQLVAKL